MKLTSAEDWDHKLGIAELDDEPFEPIIRQIQANVIRWAAEQGHPGYKAYLESVANQLDPLPEK